MGTYVQEKPFGQWIKKNSTADTKQNLKKGTSVSESKKYDDAKDRWDLLPLWVLNPVVKVLTFGATKYGDNNWKNLVDFDARYSAAFMRHFVAWQSGEKVDPESGQAHIAHMICNLIFLLWKEQQYESKLSERHGTSN